MMDDRRAIVRPVSTSACSMQIKLSDPRVARFPFVVAVLAACQSTGPVPQPSTSTSGSCRPLRQQGRPET